MRTFLLKYKNFVLFAVIIVFVYLGYSYFFGGATTESDLVTQQVDQSATIVGQDLLSTLLELRTLSLDERIFADRVFQSLQDFSQPITPLPIGRKNPFAPFGGSSGPANPGR